MLQENLKRRIETASGAKKASLVLKNGQIVNVFSNRLEQADIAIEDGVIVGIGVYKGEKEVDLTGKVICPGFLDGHIHLESSMISPSQFQRAVLPHGTTGVITDPHEIANVAGTAGIDYILEATQNLELDVFLMLPSCVPSTSLDESGAVLKAEALRPYYQHPRVIGLAEVMDYQGTVQVKPEILNKILSAHEFGRQIDGHAPFLSKKFLNAYVTAGVASDHECSNLQEAIEKLERGQWIMIREGTAAKNLEALISLTEPPYYERCMLVTDDKHPGDLLNHGHMDYIIRKAVSLGADPIRLIRMASLHTAQYFGLKQRGAVAPGYLADLVVLRSLETMEIEQVFKGGKLVAKRGECLVDSPYKDFWNQEIVERVFHSFHLEEIRNEQFAFKKIGEMQRIIHLIPRELLTEEDVVAYREVPGAPPGVDVERDIIKLAVLERHNNTGHIGLGFLHGYGLQKGAVASSIAHDSHNLIIAGTSDEDMALAGNCVRRNRGGLAIAVDGKVVAALPLPIAGLMTEASAGETEYLLAQMKQKLYRLGIPKTIDPFMTLAFVSLPVIPQLRLNTNGLIDVEEQKITESWL